MSGETEDLRLVTGRLLQRVDKLEQKLNEVIDTTNEISRHLDRNWNILVKVVRKIEVKG